jgi:hypothetical protein
MKKLIPLFFVLMITLAGCSNHQESSYEEACWVLHNQKDFAAEILLERVDSGEVLGICIGPGEPYLGNNKNHFLGDNSFSYIAVYETKEGKKKLLLLKDARPPEVALEKVLEVGTGAPTDTLTTK